MTTEPSYTCEWCGTEWRSPISASLCCDPAAFIEDEDHPTRDGIHRGID